MKNLFFTACILLFSLSSCGFYAPPITVLDDSYYVLDSVDSIEIGNHLFEISLDSGYEYINFAPVDIAFIDSKGVEVWYGCCDEYAYIDGSQEWAFYELDETNYVEGYFRDHYGILCLPYVKCNCILDSDN